MIWTPMPLELVLEDQTVRHRMRKHLLPDGGVVLACVYDYGDERISRLDATDPQLYLAPELAPGTPLGNRTSGRRRPRRPPDGS